MVKVAVRSNRICGDPVWRDPLEMSGGMALHKAQSAPPAHYFEVIDVMLVKVMEALTW